MVPSPSAAKAPSHCCPGPAERRRPSPEPATTPAERITLSTPATKPSKRNTISPQGEIPSQRSISQPRPAPTSTPANEFAREPEAPGVARCSRRPISIRTSEGWPARSRAGQDLRRDAEVSRRERLHRCAPCRGRRFRAPSLMIFDTRGLRRSRRARPLEAARTILSGFCQVKKPPSILMH